MKSKLNFLLTILVTFLLGLQGCVKDPHHIFGETNHKLLLSKVSGSLQGTDPNFSAPLFNNYNTYEWSDYNENGLPNAGVFQINFSYGRNTNGWNSYKPVLQDSFLNGGHYDFLYKNILPDKVVDNSVPGWDLGYWKFFYNGFHQVEKVGLGFSSTTDPVRFEFYSRNYKGEISSFIYGRAVDTPYMKVLYEYDAAGNISQFDIYVAKNRFPTNDLTSSIESARPASVLVTSTHALKLQSLQKRLASNTHNKPANNQRSSSGFDGGVDTSVYDFYLTARVTTDGRINPFSQQHNIFFYQTNRWYSFYEITPFYLSLLKSNPLKIEYTVPSWGPDVAVQTFSYTYNDKGYPVSVHEVFSDPDFAFAGGYTKDSQIEYIKND